ncbi:MAG: hypothetical protein AAGM67_15200 [Bacteroidota bacterium]
MVEEETRYIRYPKTRVGMSLSEMDILIKKQVSEKSTQMSVQDLIDLLGTIENKSLPVFLEDFDWGTFVEPRIEMHNCRVDFDASVGCFTYRKTDGIAEGIMLSSRAMKKTETE